MSNDTPPTPAPGIPWYQDGRYIIMLAGMLIGFGTTAIQGCTASQNAKQAAGHAAAASMQSAENAAKVDDVERKLGKVATKIGAANDK